MSKLVYLSGPIAGLTFDNGQEWRDYASERLAEFGIEGLSPLRGKEFLRGTGIIADPQGRAYNSPLTTDAAITARDRFDTQRADFMLVNLVGAPRVSIGTMIEYGWADAARVPVVTVMGPDSIHNHPMLRGLSAYLTDDLDEGIDLVLTALAKSKKEAA